MPGGKHDDELTVSRNVEDGYRRKIGKHEVDDVRNRIPWEQISA